MALALDRGTRLSHLSRAATKGAVALRGGAVTGYRPLAVRKTSVDELIDVDQRLTRLVYAYVATATVWLVVGTLVGAYLALKFVWPDLGVAQWLSFGRLRPVHTNIVFWGWASPAMLALALWVVPRTSQRRLHSIRLAAASLAL
ncbi:MAG: cytochrome oxidase subunit I, partial [Gemmatimonadetes bacterium]